MFNYFSIPNMIAGFIAVMVGFTSSAVLVFQAATTAGASPAEISSWLFSLGIGLSATCIGLSLYYRMPILTGWSTPGAALLVTSLTGTTMPEAIGAFIFAALLTALSGVTGIFAKVLEHIPRSLTAAMLAGILLHFGLNVFVAMQHQLLLVGIMLCTYLIGKRFFPRYVIMLVLAVGIALAKAQGLFHPEDIHLTFATPTFTTPDFSLATLVSIGIPLFIVNMASQNIPGITVLNASGYKPPISPLISWTGLITLILAPFGCYSINLAALSAAICTNEDADSDPLNRYKSTVFAGICWLMIGIFGATIVALFSAFPSDLIYAIAGIALLSTIGNSLQIALDDKNQHEPSIITILISASGFTIFGIGAAFWGLIAGIIASILLNWYKKEVLPVLPTIAEEKQAERSTVSSSS